MLNIHKLLYELEAGVSTHQAELLQLMSLVVAPLETLFGGLKPTLTGRGLSGGKEFMKRTLLLRCITDLIAATHLAKHHYFIQALTTARPIIESLNLVELAERDDDAVEEWLSGKWEELRPFKVRNRLGADRSDEFYNYLSSISSHPMWGMTRGMAAMAVVSGRKRVFVSVGPYLKDPLSKNYLIFSFGSLLVLLAATAMVASRHYLKGVVKQETLLSVRESLRQFEDVFVKGQHLEKHRKFMERFGATVDELDQLLGRQRGG